jgi:hypothetical protein
MHHFILFRGWQPLTARHIVESLKAGELTAKNGLIEIHSFLGVSHEIKIRVGADHFFSFISY